MTLFHAPIWNAWHTPVLLNATLERPKLRSHAGAWER
jgi:hypothetical protein